MEKNCITCWVYACKKRSEREFKKDFSECSSYENYEDIYFGLSPDCKKYDLVCDE